MQAVKQLIDFFFNSAYNLWSVYLSNGGIWASITIVVLLIYPLLRRLISRLRGSK